MEAENNQPTDWTLYTDEEGFTVREEEFLCSGAGLSCNRSSAPNNLTALIAPTVKIQGNNAAVQRDAIPLTNIKSFGMCQITVGVCVPACFQWSGSLASPTYCGGNSLTTESYITCFVGGKIKVDNSGQTGADKAVTTQGKLQRSRARLDLIAQAQAKLKAQQPPVSPNAMPADATRVAPSRLTIADEARMAATRLKAYNKAVERARLAEHAYNTHQEYPPAPPEGWRQLSSKELAKMGITPDMMRDDDSGFKASIYESNFEKPPTIVIAYAGTEDKPDLITDAGQGIGMETKQYNKSMDLAKEVKKRNRGKKVETTGHSLGGGLAAAGAIAADVEGTTFNAAGVHEKTVGRRDVSPAAMRRKAGLVDAYRSPSDPLSNFQNNGELFKSFLGTRAPFLWPITSDPRNLPRAFGKDHLVKLAPKWQHYWSELWSKDPLGAAKKLAFDGHGVFPQMVDHLEYQKEMDQSFLQRFVAY